MWRQGLRPLQKGSDMEYGHGRIRMLAEAALMLMLAMPAACFQFQAQGSLLLRSSSVSRPERIPLQGCAALLFVARQELTPDVH